MKTLHLTSGRVDLDRRTLVGRDGGTHRLTHQEAELLAYLAARPGEPVSRDELMDAVWRCRVTPGAVDVAIRRLRRSVERDPTSPDHVHSAHGVGFVFRPLAATPPPEVVDRPSFGRGELVAELTRALARRPGLVTLHGPGGIGKTHVAEAVAAAWSGPRWCVCATDPAEPGWLVAALADALGLGERARGPDEVGEALRGAGRALLVLDDLDALAEALAPTVARWLGEAPELRILVTSRVRLRLRDESCHTLPPLDPVSGAALFAHHSGRVGVTIDPHDPEVRCLVERLDGLPLAIELAAGWSRTLAPAELLETLEHPRDLAARSLDRDARHRSLDTVLDSSWRLLDHDSQDTLCHLVVFRGPFSVPDALAVMRPGASVSTIERLLDHALLRSTPEAGRRRLEVPPAVRTWLLDRDGVPPEGSEARHAARLGARCRRWFEGPADADGTLAWAQAALPDLLAAARFAVAVGDAALAAPLGALAARFGAPDEMEGLLRRVLSVSGHAPVDAGRLRGALGMVRVRRGDRAGALPLLERALDEVRDGGAPWDEARARVDLGVVLRLLGRPDDARAQLEEALALALRLGMPREEAGALVNLGAVHHERGDRQAAARCFADAAARYAELGEKGREASARLNVAMTFDEWGNLDRAAQGYARARELFREAGDPRGMAASLLGEGRVALVREPARAVPLFEAGLAAAEGGDPARESEARAHLAAARRSAGALGEALDELGRALELAQRARDRRLEAIVQVNLARTQLAAGRAGPALAAARAAESVAREHGYPAVLGVSLACRAEVVFREGDPEAARAVLDEARDLLAPVGQREELARVAALRAVISRATGGREEAAEALAEAEAALVDLGAAPGSELARHVAAAREACATST